MRPFPLEHKKLMFMFMIMLMLMILMLLVGTKLKEICIICVLIKLSTCFIVGEFKASAYVEC